MSKTLTVLFEDDELIAVDKPSGLLVHPSWISKAGEPTVMGILKQQLALDKLHTIHRLDRATSGVLLVGKSVTASQHLQRQFQERCVEKSYQCLVRGWIDDPVLIDYPLKPKADRFAEPFADLDVDPKPAVTEVTPLARITLETPVGRYQRPRYAWIQAKPKTGRKHQIRRHMKHLLHPIIGDTKYGEGRHNRIFRELFNSHRLLLCARTLDFDHPSTGERISISSPLPDDIRHLLERIGARDHVSDELYRPD